MSSLLWQLWSDEWLLYEKVSFNGDEKSIYVHPDVVDFDIRVDLWSAWVRWRAAGNDVFDLAMRRTGFDLLPDGSRTGDTYFLINGWKLYIEIEQVKVTGVLYSDDFDTAYYDITTLNPIYPVRVSSLVNTVYANGSGGGGGATPAEIWSYSNRSLTVAPSYNGPTVVQIRQEIDSSSTQLSAIKAKTDTITAAPSAASIADAVRTELSPELSHLLSLQNGQGLDSTQATMLLEIYRLYGLDPTKPLIVTNNARTAGTGIQQQIVATDNQTTITRV